MTDKELLAHYKFIVKAQSDEILALHKLIEIQGKKILELL